MSIDNKVAAIRMTWIIIFASIIGASFLLICMLCKIDNLSVYTGMISFLLVMIFRLATLKYFKLEISEELISIKYNHPLLKGYTSAKLELPWYKIRMCKLEKGILFHYICICVSGKKKDKIFHYNLGFLSKVSICKIEDNLKNTFNDCRMSEK